MSPEVSPVSTMDERSEVLRQLEFYFSDSNFLGDKFLREVAEKDNGFVDIDTLAKFKRMVPYADKRDLIIDAVNVSTRLKLNDDNTKIARVDPLPNPDAVLSRMIYVKGLDKFNNAPNTDLQQKYEEFFGALAKCLSVRLVRVNKTFISKAFVEYETPEEVENVLNTPHVQNDKPLSMETVKAYASRKAEQWNVSTKFVLDRIIDRKYLRPKETEAHIIPKTCAEELYGEINGKRFLHNSLVRYSNAPEGLTVPMLKPYLLTAPTTVRFIDTSDKGQSGVFQLEDPKAEEFIEKMQNELNIKDNVLTLSRIEGEEEKQYWDSKPMNVGIPKSYISVEEQKNLKKNNSRHFNKRGGRGGRGGRGRGNRHGGNGGHKRARDDGSDNEHDNAKQQKTDNDS